MQKRNSIITVDLDAITRNIQVLKSHISGDTKTMAVVKANAYGHGAVEVARHIQSQVEWFAVNDIDEGVELRENGITNPILIFGVPEAEVAALYAQYNLTATVSALQQFEVLHAGTEYHFNFNTGMSRLGFRPEQVEDVIEAQQNHPEFTCTGIYSHFATADEPSSAKPDKQQQVFDKIHRQFDSTLVVHMCNSAGIIQCADVHFNMVRFGIGMYGYAPGKVQIPDLQPALSWQTQLVQVNPIKKGETVSYGARWKAEEEGYVGIIPVGYADGVPRALSHKFEVSIEHETYPIVGTVTMNYCMVWLGKKEFDTGTKVELLNKHLSAKHWAQTTGTIPYEILTGILNTIPRKYKTGKS